MERERRLRSFGFSLGLPTVPRQKSSTPGPENHRYAFMTSRIAACSLFGASLLFGRLGLAAEQDYAARFKALQAQKAHAQIEPLLDEWRAQKPNDPEAWVTSANYYFNQSVGPARSTRKPEKGDFSLTDKKTGKAAGSISLKPNVGQTSHSETDPLQEATGKLTTRLDIWCEPAVIFQSTGHSDSERGESTRM